MYSSADVIWTLVAAFLVFFMQAGFALCEAGLTRAKNTGNILMKNMMDFCIGTPCFWLVGFGVMFAGSGAFIGGFDPFIQGSYDFGTLPVWVYVIFQTVFCATAATIVSGSMAERTKFKAYCLYSAAISLIVYPVSGHWIWGGGWLSQLGFHDFAGSTAVHFVGGVCACLGAWMLGPRIGKYWSAEPMSTRFGTLETKNTDFSFVLHSRGSNIDSSPNFGCIRKKMCPMPTVNFVGQIHTFQGHIQNVFI